MAKIAAWCVRAVVLTTILVLVLGVIKRLDPLQEGLLGQYFLGPGSTSAPARSSIDAPPSTKHLADGWNGRVPEAFSATWSGGLLILREGRYTFGTVSDDASHLYVDGELVVDNGGAHGPVQKTGSVHLTRGVHAIFIDYNQQGGGYLFELLWSRNDERLRRVPSWALSAGKVGFARFLASVAIWRALAPLEWAWIVALAVLLSTWIARASRPVVRALKADGTWTVAKWIVLGSLLLNAAGIWWGLPGGWPPGEVTPKAVLAAVSKQFANGWYDTYPPFHFYVLSATIGPALWLHELGRIDLSGAAGYTSLVLLMRGVSLAMAAVAIVAACLAGTRAFGPRAGLLGAAALALTTTFVYYAKTANVDMPYLVWFAVSVVLYLRVLDHLRLRDFVLFAVTATLAVCTKDQAYGLYLLMPAPIVHRLWQVNRQARLPAPFIRALVDRRLVTAAITAAVLFAACHNLPFNLQGFRDHVQFLIGPGSVDYQVYDATAAGRLELLALTGRLIRESFGWPFFVTAVGGMAIAARSPKLKLVAVWLIVPVVSYYLSFINVILYNYDRFVMPICFVLALFAGLAMDRFLAWRPGLRRWRVAVVGAAFAYTLLYTAAIDALMIGDSRYSAERWLQAHVGHDDFVGSTFALEYLPRLDEFRREEIRSVAALQERRPGFYVLNADYARAEPSDSPTGALIAALQDGSIGYSRAVTFRTPSPWRWLPGGHHDLVGPRQEKRVATILRNINPTIEIFEGPPK